MRRAGRPVCSLMPARTALLAACAGEPAPSYPRDVTELRWLKSYPGESRSGIETGLLWGLSLLEGPL